MKTLATLALVAALTSSAFAELRTRRPGDDVLKKELTPLQFQVTRENGTEPPFKNEYWNHKKPGIYVDITTGQPLFSSLDKYDSGTGWPSFWRPIDKGVLVWRPDRSHGATRTEIRSVVGDIHLGHVFSDGPKPTGHRYCMNSAALRFIPADQLAKAGYAKYAPLFAAK
ncbi:MAG: peptide-methionine (R)-S-oxide reductase MsrB [Kofleriaceae bacterium]